MKPNLLLLFGAGASAHSGICLPAPPPLGDDLFEAMVAQGCVVPNSLPGECEALFRRKAGFELGMQALAATSSFEYFPFLRAMAHFFAPYKPGDDNLYVRLFAQLFRGRKSFTVATLNYENLIERALLRSGGFVNYSGSSARRIVRVIKPHGSCGFIPRSLGLVLENVAISGFKVDIEAAVLHLIDESSIVDWLSAAARQGLAPCMSFYAPGKRTPVGGGEIERQRADWALACDTSDVCFIVGVRCNSADTHIWDPLARSRCRLFFVNPSGEDLVTFDAWATANKRAAVLRPVGFEDCVEEIIGASA